MNEINWNLRTETLDAIAEEALNDEEAGTLFEMVRIGTKLEREGYDHNDGDHREAAYRCAVAISKAYSDEVERIANEAWAARGYDLNSLAISERDVYDAMCDAFYNKAMGISYA